MGVFLSVTRSQLLVPTGLCAGSIPARGALPADFQPTTKLYAEASQFAPSLGLQAYWFSDHYSVCMEA